MPQSLILWPVAAQVALTLVVLFMMGPARARSMKARRQGYADVALNHAADWDAQATKVANNFRNQFEVPVLFYACTAHALALRLVDPWLFGLACVFVVSRVAHAAVHIGPNVVPLRGGVWLVGVAAVIAMWGVLLASALRSGF